MVILLVNKTLTVSPQKSVLSETSHATNLVLIGFVLIHIPLALLLRSFPLLATLHALSCLAIGLFAGLLWSEQAHLPLWSMGYIVGAEVLWRSTGAAGQIAWEFGKYAVGLILAILILRTGSQKQIPMLPVIFLVCLLSSVVGGVFEGFFWLRYRFIGSLSGPAILAISAIFFTGLKLNQHDLQRLVMVILAPSVSVGVIVIYNVLALGAEGLRFGRTSNQLITGGAANQVSNALALGVIVCWLLLISGQDSRLMQSVIFMTMGGLTIVMLLTFSRGGAMTAGIAVLGTLPFSIRDNSRRWQVLIIAALCFAVFYIWLWPWFDEYTGGSAGARFSNLESSRWDLAEKEIEIWLRNPILGVGPGLARNENEIVDFFGGNLQPHVEYTRLLAEHGVLGLIALICLGSGFVKNLSRSQDWRARCWVMALTVFAFAYMVQAATRTVAPGFIYGLTWATLFVPSEKQECSPTATTGTFTVPKKRGP